MTKNNRPRHGENEAAASGPPLLFCAIVIAGRLQTNVPPPQGHSLLCPLSPHALLSRAQRIECHVRAAWGRLTQLLRRGGVSYQVERIVRTEVSRVYSIALDTQVQALAAAVL